LLHFERYRIFLIFVALTSNVTLSACDAGERAPTIDSSIQTEIVRVSRLGSDVHIDANLGAREASDVISELAGLLRSIRSRFAYEKKWAEGSYLSITVRYRPLGSKSDVSLVQLHTRHDTYVSVAPDASDGAILTGFDYIDWGSGAGSRLLRQACNSGGSSRFCEHQFDNW
jgi:hypothetical protein